MRSFWFLVWFWSTSVRLAVLPLGDGGEVGGFMLYPVWLAVVFVWLVGLVLVLGRLWKRVEERLVGGEMARGDPHRTHRKL